MKVKVLCPNHGYGKILMAFETDRKRYWVYCDDHRCKRWVQVDINDNGGITTTLMPKNYHFDFEKQPILVKET